MIVEEYGKCSSCERDVDEGTEFCSNCGTKLDWQEYNVYFPPEPMPNVMRYGTINCDCGQNFYFESKRLHAYCIKCGKSHDVSNFPTKEDGE